MTEMLKVAIVDDEPLSLDYLADILSKVPETEIHGLYKNGREALAGLLTNPVDVLFLDIQMPGFNGFDVVKRLQSDTMPLIVFATAFDDFALQAFELHAVDYILKPFESERVGQAVSRARERWMARRALDDAEDELAASGKGAALAAIESSQTKGGKEAPWTGLSSDDIAKLPIKDGQQTVLLEYETIDWVDAAGDYMCVHASGETHILRSTMKELEQRLPAYFARIHRSTIVNINRIERVEGLPKGEAMLHTSSGSALKVSRNYRTAIQHLLA